MKKKFSSLKILLPNLKSPDLQVLNTVSDLSPSSCFLKKEFSLPDRDCKLCPRLEKYRHTNRFEYPGKHNAPVPSFGFIGANFLIVGLAPGLRGANVTGRPFTGDFAGDLLYETLLEFGLAKGAYGGHSQDGLRLVNCRITNAVRCVPPENRPIGAEVATCGKFLSDEIASMKELKVILALGVVAHGAVLAALGMKKNAFKFSHGACHQLTRSLTLADSYHCSRYNTNTKRLTKNMFRSVFEKICRIL